MERVWEISLAAFIAAFVATTLFYECLSLISRLASGMAARPRPIMFVMITGIFMAHVVAILVYAALYWALIHYAGFADLSGNISDHFPTYLYFSATSYSSLGVGNVFPLEGLRFLTGIEAINGLILITCSITFTYFSVQKMWEAHDMEARFYGGGIRMSSRNQRRGFKNETLSRPLS